MGDQVISHVVTLHLHLGAHKIKGRGGDGVALAIDLPGDGRVRRADGIGTRRTGGRSGVDGEVRAHISIDDHTAHEVGTEVGLVVDDSKDLALDADGLGNLLLSEGSERFHVEVAEDAVVEGSLILVGSSAGSGGRVGPMNLVRLSNLNTDAVLPVICAGVYLGSVSL